MIVNGKEANVAIPCCLAEFLAQNNYSTDKIAVELNGAIIARKDYTDVFLQDSDALEIVAFVGGG